MYLFGLTYAIGTESLVSSDFSRSMTCFLRLGAMGPPGQSLSLCNNGPVGPLFASLAVELTDNVAMGRRKLFPSSGSMALPRRVFRTLSRPRGCANPAYTQSSKTKRTYLSRAYANILTCCRHAEP